MLDVIKKRLRPEKGQVLVFSILLLPLVLGILALVVEMGNLYVHYWQLQSAADITAVAVTRNMTAIAIRREFATIYREVDAVCRLIAAILKDNESEFAGMTPEEIKDKVITEIYSDSIMTIEAIDRIKTIATTGINFDSMSDDEKTLIAEVVADEENGEKVFFDKIADEKRTLVLEIDNEISYDYMTDSEKNFIAEIVIDHSDYITEIEITTLIEKIADNINFKNMSDYEKEFIAEIVADIDFANVAECEKSRIAGIANEIFANETDFDNVTEEEKELITKIANMSNMDNIKENFPIKSFKPDPSGYPDSNKFYVKLEKNVESFFERVFDKKGINLPARAAASIDITSLKPKLTPITKPEIEIIEPSDSDDDNWREVTP